MKNIHLLPTQKPSKLHFDDKLFLSTNYLLSKGINSIVEGRNIYITNNEEIKEGSIVKIPCGVGRVKELHWKYGNDFPSYIVEDIFTYKLRFLQKEGELQTNSFRYEDVKKIILTTDRKLIKDGVQAIDDEFLEWFCKNSSYEWVDVKSLKTIPALQLTGNNHCMYQLIVPKEEESDYNGKQEIKWISENQSCKQIDSCYNSLSKKCICPKEEPKQETLEEAVERIVKSKVGLHYFGNENSLENLAKKEYIIEGAKWQQEQDKKLYSEEEVRKIVWESRKFFHEYKNTPFNKVRQVFYEWFEQFKKK